MEQRGPVVVTGGTGLVGQRLVRRLRGEGRPVRLVTRRQALLEASAGVERVTWDGLQLDPAALAAAEALVHLAGEPIFGGLPSAARRRQMWRSRVDSTHSLVRAIGQLPRSERPTALVCASAVGIYGDAGEAPLSEEGPLGEGFLAELCKAWEGEARAVAPLGVRPVLLRMGLVLAREGGALAALSALTRLGLAGRVGSGRQWVPWVHAEDVIGLILHALGDAAMEGPVNAVSPGIVRNRELVATLARVLHRPSWLPVPAFALRWVLGPLAGELLDSRRVLPVRARQRGYAFRFAALEPTLATELSRPPSTAGPS